MTAIEIIADAINQINEKKEKLKKAFDDLQAHRSLLSPSFSLSWSEIDSHFSSVQSSLSNRFRLIQSAAPCADDSNKIDIPQAGTSEEETFVLSELRTLCEKMNGVGLTKYLIDQWDDDAPLNMELSAAIRYSSDPASMVLDAIEGSHPAPSSRKLIDVRRVFILLLETLIEINANVTVDIRDRAKKVAYDWKSLIDVKPFEALLFLHLVAAFKLESEFSDEELSEYVFMIAKYKQSTLVCNKLGLDSETVANLIKKLLDSGKSILSVRFMYECKMTHRFQPIPILKSCIKDCREATHRACTKDNYSLQKQNEATDREVSALKAVIKIIKEQNIESEFTQEKVEERVQELEKQKQNAQRKRNMANLQKEPQQKGRKRPRVRNGTQVPALSQQPFSRQEAVLLPEPGYHGLQLNPFGILNSPALGRVVVPIYGSAATPQAVHYGQQTGFVLPGQYHPPYYTR